MKKTLLAAVLMIASSQTFAENLQNPGNPDYMQMSCNSLKYLYLEYNSMSVQAQKELDTLMGNKLDKDTVNRMQAQFTLGRTSVTAMVGIAHAGHDVKHCSWVSDSDIIAIDKAYEYVQKKLNW